MQKGAEITAGPSNTVVVDNQRMYWMAGKVCIVYLFYYTGIDALYLSGRLLEMVICKALLYLFNL